MWKFYMEYLYHVRFFFSGQFMWDTKILKHTLLVVSHAAKMSSIVNSSQYCYFNSLAQCLSNVAIVHRLLEEHTQMLEQGEGMKVHF